MAERARTLRSWLAAQARALRRGSFAVGAGMFLGLMAAFGLVAPVFVPNPVVEAAPAQALPPLVEYQRLLDDHLQVLRRADPARPGEAPLPVATTFDYARLAAWPDGVPRLERARRELLSVRPSRLAPPARLAWAINLYNLLVIDAVVRHGFPGGRPVASVRDLTIAGKPFFEAPLVVIEARPYSLDRIEREFLLAGFDRAAGGAPPAGLDPRVHFAVVCGARGCPPLLPRAYRPETLDQQLDHATRGALLGAKHLRWYAMTKTLEASRIFDWYAADFGGVDGAFAFLLKHASARDREGMVAAGFTRIPAFIEWDWALNQTPANVR